ncbi:MAG: hypothetical protein MMC33_001352 [Icmadophila ericetorum]|nr:hypothetical protein [Icmadophila ericetorum]
MADVGLQICGCCLKSSEEIERPMDKCSRCLVQVYCSKECQIKNWKAHSELCKRPNYVVRVQLAPGKIVQPPIYRTISCPAKATFQDLHSAIQVAFGWYDDYLYSFKIHDPASEVNLSAPEVGGSANDNDSETTTELGDQLSTPTSPVTKLNDRNENIDGGIEKLDNAEAGDAAKDITVHITALDGPKTDNETKEFNVQVKEATTPKSSDNIKDTNVDVKKLENPKPAAEYLGYYIIAVPEKKQETLAPPKDEITEPNEEKVTKSVEGVTESVKEKATEYVKDEAQKSAKILRINDSPAVNEKPLASARKPTIDIEKIAGALVITVAEIHKLAEFSKHSVATNAQATSSTIPSANAGSSIFDVNSVENTKSLVAHFDRLSTAIMKKAAGTEHAEDIQKVFKEASSDVERLKTVIAYHDSLAAKIKTFGGNGIEMASRHEGISLIVRMESLYMRDNLGRNSRYLLHIEDVQTEEECIVGRDSKNPAPFQFSQAVRLFEVFEVPKYKNTLIEYKWDYNKDNWRHVIALVGRNSHTEHFVCIGGEGASAIEDIGGVNSFNYLKAAHKAKKPTPEQMDWMATCKQKDRSWRRYKDKFDEAEWYKPAINDDLKEIKMSGV